MSDQGIKDEQQDQTSPLPFLHTSLLCILLITEPLAASVTLPFIFFMVRDFGSMPEGQVGFYAGIVASAFYAAQTITSMLWSFMADHASRRALFVISLIGNIVALVCFGASPSLQAAIGFRLASGAFNGIVGVARGSIRDVTDTTNEAKAYSLAGFAWGIGWIIGPACGGFLSNPATQYPDVFGKVQILINYPYLLPCMVASFPALIGIVTAALLPCEVPQEEDYAEVMSMPSSPQVRPQLVNKMSSKASMRSIRSRMTDRWIPESQGQMSLLAAASATPTDARLTFDTPPQMSLLATATTNAAAALPDLALSRTTTMLSGTPSRRHYSGLPLMRTSTGGSAQKGLQLSRTSTASNTPTKRGANRDAGDRLVDDGQRGSASLFGSPRDSFSRPRRSMLFGRDVSQTYTDSVVDSDDDYEEESDIFDMENGRGRRKPRNKSLATRMFESNEDGVVNLADFYISKREAEVNAEIEQEANTEPTETDRLLSPALSRYQSNTSLRTRYQTINTPSDDINEEPKYAKALPTLLIIVYANLALHCTVFDQLYSTMLVSPSVVDDKPGPGMGLQPTDMARLIAVMGIVQLFGQFWLYPRVQSLQCFVTGIGPLGIYLVGTTIYLPTVVSFPFLRHLAPFNAFGGSNTGWPLLTLLISSRFTAGVLTYTPIMVLLNSPQFTPPEKLSFANGLAQSACSLARALGPTLGGALYSFSLEGVGADIGGGPGYAGFYFVAGLVLLGAVGGWILIRQWMRLMR